MPRINLLPWREEQRKQRQKNFGIAAVGAVVAGGLIIWLSHFVFESLIDHQKQRNTRLTDEIAEIQKSITEIQNLEKQKEQLLSRMEIIETLQTSRPEVVHLFDEIVKTLPNGVFLTNVEQEGRNLRFTGVAQSSTRVSALMRNIVESEWLTNPDLDKIETIETNGIEEFRFELKLQQVDTSNETEQGAAQ